jgi:hypothetical protein
MTVLVSSVGTPLIAAAVLIFGMMLICVPSSTIVAISIYVLPLLSAASICYALSESIGRLACLTFGCC